MIVRDPLSATNSQRAPARAVAVCLASEHGSIRLCFNTRYYPKSTYSNFENPRCPALSPPYLFNSSQQNPSNQVQNT
jgi:hypothetical protein